MTTPERWTGHEARLLRSALRMSVRSFAAHLGVAERTVSTWEKVGRRTRPWPSSQAILDTSLARASDEARARFVQLIEADTVFEDTPNRGAMSIRGFAWPADGASARAAAVALWATEPSDTSIGSGMQVATHSMIFKWLLVRQPDDLGTGPSQDSSRNVTRDDVAALRAMNRSLTGLDDEHGGGAALPLTLKYLSSEVAPLLHGRFNQQLGRELFRTAAELALLAGWMAYDAGRHGYARQQMLHALRLSQVAGDRLFGGRVLVAMSHQALHIGHIQDGIDFAAAAARGARAEGVPVAVALFASSEARALAVSGDKRTCLSMMRDAERALSKAPPADGPEWLAFMDEAELAGRLGRCLRDLGMHREAQEYLDASLTLHKPQYLRSRAITKLVQATNYVRQGELEPACQLGLNALPDIGRLRSQRTKEYLADLYRGLSRYQREPLVLSFREQAERLVMSGQHGRDWQQ